LLQNISQQVTFRLYGYNPDGNDRSGYFSVDGVKVKGTTTAVPTPAAIPAIIAFGAGLWGKRKQQNTEVA
jgi:hypothetical protein